MQVASDETLEQAFRWLCQQRKDHSHNSDVWMVRERWEDLKPVLQRELRAGCFRFGALRRVRVDGQTWDIWNALDALVLKAMAIVLTPLLARRLSRRCFHLVGNGGAKAAVRDVLKNRGRYSFVMRSDVRDYYASIDHDVLFGLLRQHISDPRMLDLLWQYMRRTIYDDGRYQDVTCGISLGCPLSPLMGALYLSELDRAMEKTGLFYARFMDDWIILAPTRWKLRDAVRIVNRTLARLKVEKHPDKTYIGRIGQGFDFLGYRIDHQRIVVARSTRQRFAERISQLYEQDAGLPRIGRYIRHWRRWTTAGLQGLITPQVPLMWPLPPST